MKDASARNGLVIERRDGYLYTRITHPTLNREKALETLAEIVLRCADIYCKRILIERDIYSEPDDEEFYSAMRDLMRFSPGIRIALVNRRMSPDNLADNIGQPGDVGGAIRKYFDNEKAAETWLMSD